MFTSQSFQEPTCEYDSAKAFGKEGAEVNLVPSALDEEAIVKSVETMVDNIGKANILFFCMVVSQLRMSRGSASLRQHPAH